jgi:hypothetical protein
MKATLIAIAVPVCAALIGSTIQVVNERTVWSLVQLFGAGFLGVVVLTHVAEAFRLFPWMGWGDPDTAGHYFDLFSAVTGLALFPAGYLARRIAKRHAARGI